MLHVKFYGLYYKTEFSSNGFAKIVSVTADPKKTNSRRVVKVLDFPEETKQAFHAAWTIYMLNGKYSKVVNKRYKCNPGSLLQIQKDQSLYDEEAENTYYKVLVLDPVSHTDKTMLLDGKQIRDMIIEKTEEKKDEED